MIGLIFTLFLIQDPVAVASATRSTTLPQDDLVLDEAWIVRHEGRAGGVLWPQGAWNHQLLDADGDGLNDLPPGIDALTWFPRSGRAQATACDFAFSTEGSYQGFLDGDLLRMTPGGGLELLYSEDQIEQLLGLLSGSMDLDAVAYRDPLLYFSLRDGVDTQQLGPLDDGDVLRLDLTTGGVDRPFREQDLEAMVVQALGTSVSIGDVRSLSFHPHSGELLFSIQSPSDHDASVFSTAGGGALLAQWEEGDWGFLVATELDALAFLPDGETLPQPPILAVDSPSAAPGELVYLRGRHGTPHGTMKGIYARRRGFQESPWASGAIFLDQEDALYQFRWTNHIFLPTALDGAGEAVFEWTAPDLPPQFSHLDFHFQVLDVASMILSPPLTVRVQ